MRAVALLSRRGDSLGFGPGNALEAAITKLEDEMVANLVLHDLSVVGDVVANLDGALKAAQNRGPLDG